MSNIRVTIWNEYRHERENEHVAALYPAGIHAPLVEALRRAGLSAIRVATLDEPEHGLSVEALAETDVLVWWGHIAQREVSAEVTERVYQRVLEGMGLVVLHSGHNAEVFKKLMGTSCRHRWREGNDHARLWVVAPGHPIAEGIGEYVDIEHDEMYGEHFDVPPPEQLVFVSWFSGGEIFRSGCCYTRGSGKIFYFQPGHEEMPVYHHPQIQRIIANAVGWAAPTLSGQRTYGNTPALEVL